MIGRTLSVFCAGGMLLGAGPFGRAAQAAEPSAAPELVVGLGPGLGGGDAASVGFSLGALAAWFPTRRVGVQAVVREGYWANEPRFVGQIGFAPRWRASEQVDGWLGFVHHHETPVPVAAREPLGAIAGAAEGIAHRSGADLGVSYGLPLGAAPGRVTGVGRLDLVGSVFPDAAGPLVYGQLWLTVALEVQELRRGGG